MTNILYSEGVYIWWQIHYTQKVCTCVKYIILRRHVHMTNTSYSEGVYIWQLHYTQKACTYDSYTQKVCTYIVMFIYIILRRCVHTHVTNTLYSEGVYIYCNVQIHYSILRRCVHVTNTLYSEGVVRLTVLLLSSMPVTRRRSAAACPPVLSAWSQS